jgi:hypothetical protein
MPSIKVIYSNSKVFVVYNNNTCHFEQPYKGEFEFLEVIVQARSLAFCLCLNSPTAVCDEIYDDTAIDGYALLEKLSNKNTCPVS